MGGPRFEQEIANSQAERMQERAELLARIERLEQQPLDTQLSSSTTLPSRVEAIEKHGSACLLCVWCEFSLRLSKEFIFKLLCFISEFVSPTDH